MLYITTRNKIDSYTAHRVLHEGTAPNGGLFLPIRFPFYSQEQIQGLREKSFCETVAEVLNVFFSSGLTGWDVEFVVGRKPVSFSTIGRKLTVAELWKNTEYSYSICANRIYALLCDNKIAAKKPQGWPAVAIRIAFAFALYGLLLREGVEAVDFAVSGGKFEAVIALWFAGKMGLPVGKIICGSNENCGIWDLIHKGQIDTGATVVSTDTPDMDQAAPDCLEYLIYSTLGLSENLRYLNAISQKGSYQVTPVNLPLLNDGLFCSVVGRSRMQDIIKSVYGTNSYLIDPYGALSYGALQDYRAKSGENRMTVLLTEERPYCYSDVICSATGLSAQQIDQLKE